MKNNAELRAVITHNEALQSKLDHSQDTLITALLMSIEGGQVLYGPISGSEDHLLDPFTINQQVKDEILGNVKYLKNLPHRLFFITLAHFTQNHVVGYAKTIDRDPENFQHRLPAALAKFPMIRNFIVTKNYDGFNETENIGKEVVDSFLMPTNTVHRKPTYIDVKHMDIKARVQYYYWRREFERDHGVKIPIIASHFAVSGENQAMAAATGLWPNFDRYPESENPFKYYKKEILRHEEEKKRARFWKNVMNGTNYSRDTMTPFEMNLYSSLDFLNPNSRTTAYDPFSGYRLDSNKNAGWFYSWSLNLFDEEIIEINKSDGIIGLLLDPRQLGGFAPNYARHEKETLKRYEEELDLLKGQVNETQLSSYGLSYSDLKPVEYLKSEPLLRNIFYIVRLIKQQQDAERNPSKYSWFVRDSVSASKDPWKFISIGSDYDGLIDPIDYAPTASYVPQMHKRLIVYAYLFSRIHRDMFHAPDSGLFINDLPDSRAKMRQLFYENGKNFMLTYF